ncbi:KilA-N domain-containing protein [Fusobacterium ulcerans]|uniref:KilA-N domain-containing protein n=1 Tax=Fusobacterium ulcerans TaxID=861 RepID=UPI001E111944|nr:KilA-N domain-containing protein [Fusobacterium ulcerans]
MNNLVIKEYLGTKIEFKMVDGCVYANATSMCKAFEKQPSDWLKIKSTQEYVEELERSENLPNGLVEVVQGGISQNQGTWIHEKLILDLARWLNVKFRVWCDEQIATLLREGKVETKPLSFQEIAIATLQEQLKQNQRIDILEGKVDNQIRVDNGEQEKIRKNVNIRVLQRVEILENFENKPKMFAALHRDLKNRFGVASYRDIKRKDLKDVLLFISTWIEPAELKIVEKSEI